MNIQIISGNAFLGHIRQPHICRRFIQPFSGIEYIQATSRCLFVECARRVGELDIRAKVQVGFGLRIACGRASGRPLRTDAAIQIADRGKLLNEPGTVRVCLVPHLLEAERHLARIFFIHFNQLMVNVFFLKFLVLQNVI